MWFFQVSNETAWVIVSATVEGTVFDIPVGVNGTMVLMGMVWGFSYEENAEIMESIHNKSAVDDNAKAAVNGDSAQRVTVDKNPVHSMTSP